MSNRRTDVELAGNYQITAMTDNQLVTTQKVQHSVLFRNNKSLKKELESDIQKDEAKILSLVDEDKIKHLKEINEIRRDSIVVINKSIKLIISMISDTLNLPPN